MNCSGEGMGLTSLTISLAAPATDERLSVELTTGSTGCTHGLMTLDLYLPLLRQHGTDGHMGGLSQFDERATSVEDEWDFSSGLEDGRDLSLRSLYNASVGAFLDPSDGSIPSIIKQMSSSNGVAIKHDDHVPPAIVCPPLLDDNNETHKFSCVNAGYYTSAPAVGHSGQWASLTVAREVFAERFGKPADDWGSRINSAIQAADLTGVVHLPLGRLEISTPIKLWHLRENSETDNTTAAGVPLARLGEVWAAVKGGRPDDTATGLVLQGVAGSPVGGSSLSTTTLVWVGAPDMVVIDVSGCPPICAHILSPCQYRCSCSATIQSLPHTLTPLVLPNIACIDASIMAMPPF